ncbi:MULTISPECIES: TIGR02301 family protein [unclassified Rhizobium]|uniref:TIGR02301 family protein n=1 Tax=unclassified Rhizobium TaxID=2613769 RepID=UPI000AB69FBD|nr:MULTISPECIES: TIGR02301 family protein [unclassified Rhizobium]
MKRSGLAESAESGIFAGMTLAPLSRRVCRLRCATACLLLLAMPLPVALAQPAAERAPAPSVDTAAPKPAPYDARLLRMAEIVGSVTYLRTLCADASAGEWREDMQALIDREAGAEADRKARLTAAFNRGYRSFAAVYTRCTPSARLADKRYRDEGATLAAEIVSRFGN